MSAGPGRPSRTDRGLSTPLSHVLTVAITTLLIIGLVLGATGLLDAQTERTAREELDTVGNRLAATLDRVDSLASRGDGVNVTATDVDRIAGSTYDAVLKHGSCASVRTDTCLELSATEFRYSPTIPIHNETRLSLQSHGNGRFTISSDGGDDSAGVQMVSFDPSSRIGVGREVGSGPTLGVGGAVSERPRPIIDFDPDKPQLDDVIQFDAGRSFDPDGSIDEYRWDFDDDGTFEKTGETTFWDYSTAGTKNVTLQVDDDSGTTSSASVTFDVVGLVYNDDLAVDPTDDREISFTATNHYAEQIELERIAIDPADSSIDRLFAGNSRIEISISSAGSSGYVYWRNHPGLEFADGGSITHLAEDGYSNDGLVTVDPGDDVRVTLRRFDETISSGDEFTIGLRYRVDELRRGSTFTDTPGP